MHGKPQPASPSKVQQNYLARWSKTVLDEGQTQIMHKIIMHY